ncbi:orotate phosphoribosyltransferase [Bacillus sp. HMF5848]|uniref:orotate phosphoribosyltransferase n=1 Tax=Bacillus sp. HMF5848 TaxID=2495421 RepID=UPI000F7B84DF|nr:orotate phosphoribosyltransferase [Bacillus sp. HMF5848]RSK26970.1 orotate phosphoribosyltransferase [Bacillus sp. HMF5848]
MNRLIAEQLLQIGAVTLSPKNPYIWSSGIKSPIYCDNRLTMSYPEVRNLIANALTTLIKEKFSNTSVIAGTATAGIPHAAWVSDRMELPMVYVRSKAKGHGKTNQIEGKINKGDKVVVIEDLISTGGSSLTAVEALRNEDCDVLAVISIFTYGLNKAVNAFNEANIPFYSLCDYDTLLEVAKNQGILTSEQLEKLVQWRTNPQDEKWLK